MNKNFKAKLKTTAVTIVTALGIVFSPLNAEGATAPNCEESFCQCQEKETVVAIDNDSDIIFKSVTTDEVSVTESDTPQPGQYNFNADEAINKAFTDYHIRVGESALSLKPIADKFAALLHDVRVEGVVMTGCPEEEYLNICLYMPGNVLISISAEEEDPIASVNIYHSQTLMAANVANINDLHTMLISVQSRNV